MTPAPRTPRSTPSSRTASAAPPSLAEALAALERLAPLEHAADWDNVGLLVEPWAPRPIRNVLLAIDATAAVLDEARRTRADLLVAYHPPVFTPQKRITTASAAGRAVLRAATDGFAVYAPHTALDAAPGGINDWLARGLGAREATALQPHARLPATEQVKVVVFVPEAALATVRTAMAAAGAGAIGAYSACSFAIPGTGSFHGSAATNPAVGRRGRLEFVPELRLEMVAPEAALPAIERAIRAHHPYEEPAWEVYRLVPRPAGGTGQGRRIVLERPVPVRVFVERVKRLLRIGHARLALARRHVRRPGRVARIESVAFCPGAGGSVLEHADADLLLTGEMRHHDVLAAQERGSSVLLCEHSNTERPYLATFARRLAKELPRARVRASKADAEPLQYV